MLQGLYKNEYEPRGAITDTPGVSRGRDFLALRGWNDDEVRALVDQRSSWRPQCSPLPLTMDGGWAFQFVGSY